MPMMHQCAVCGAEFDASRHPAQRLCSRSCANKARAKPNFWSKVDRVNGSVPPTIDTACWPWTSARCGKGYGTVTIDMKIRAAHRVAWELSNGPIPEGISVLHRCDNPICCNPTHLFLGTNADNMADMARKGRGGAPRGDRGTGAKLNLAQVREIRELVATGASQASMARRFGVSTSAVSLIMRGKNWRHFQ